MSIEDYLVDFSNYIPFVNVGDKNTATDGTDNDFLWQETDPLKAPNFDGGNGRALSNLTLGNFGGYKYKTRNWVMTYRWQMNDNFWVMGSGNALQLEKQLTLDDGNSIVIRTELQDTGGGTPIIRATIVTPTGAEQSTNLPISSSFNGWLWIRITKTVSGNDTLWDFEWQLTDKSTTLPTSGWTTPTAMSQHTFSNGKNRYITRLKLVGGWTDVSTSHIFSMDDFLITSEDEPYTNPDMDLGDFTLLSVDTQDGIGGVGRALLVLDNPGLSDSDNIEALQKKAFTIKDLVYGKPWFRGEVNRIRTSWNEVKLEAVPAQRKIRKTRTKVTNIIERRQLYFADNSFQLFDWTANYPVLGEWNNKFIKFTKSNLFELTVFATTAVYKVDGIIHVPDDPMGDYTFIYYPRDTTAGEWNEQTMYAHDTTSNPNDSKHRDLELTFEFWCETGTEFDDIELYMQFRTRNIRPGGIYFGAGSFPRVDIYDYNLGSYEVIKNITTDEGFRRGTDGTFSSALGGTGQFRSPLHVVKKLVSKLDENLVDYITTSTVVNNYTKHEIKVRLRSGWRKTIGSQSAAEISHYYSRLKVVCKTKQIADEGVGTVSATEKTKITMNAAVVNSWQNKEISWQDGFTKFDVFEISDSFEDVVADVWTESGLATKFNLIWQSDLGSNIPIDGDIIDLMVGEFLDTGLKKVNGFWYHFYDVVDTPPDSIKVLSTSNIVSTGVVLINDDILEIYDDNWELTTDTEDQISEIKVKGKNTVYEINPQEQFEPDLGPDMIIINDPSITYTSDAIARGDTYADIFTNVQYNLVFTVNLNSRRNAYNLLAKGESVGVILTDRNGVIKYNFTSGNLGELLIADIQHKRGPLTKGNDFLILTLQLRY